MRAHAMCARFSFTGAFDSHASRIAVSEAPPISGHSATNPRLLPRTPDRLKLPSDLPQFLRPRDPGMTFVIVLYPSPSHESQADIVLRRVTRMPVSQVTGAPELLPKVFDMFSQAEGSVKRDSGGLGIGLSLTKQLAEMHGGRIEGESAGIGRGACFRLWLPKNSPFATRAKMRGVADPSILKGLRVLLVDDSIEGLEAFGALLELEGAEVSAESSARKAVALAMDGQFDLILSDIAMPDMNGYELVETLREQPNTAKVPAIALTGFGRDQDAARAMRAGFDAHIGKPVTLSALLAVLGANMLRP
jgi:CheY-like chemotaxis protein